MPRVLFLAHRLNLTGVARHMCTLGAGLIENGYRVAVAARDLDPGTPFGAEYFRSHGLQLYQVDFPNFDADPANALRLVRSVRQFRGVLRAFSPDVLHVHAPTLSPIAGLLAPTCARVTTFNIEVDSPLKQRLGRWANALFPRPFGDRALCISSEMERQLRERLGFAEGRLRLIPYGVDAALFRPPSAEERRAARARFGLPQNAFVACMVAVLEPRKNHRLLLSALEALRQARRPAYALFAGDGPLRQGLAAETEARGLAEHVRWLGHADPRPVYAASDAVVLPSTREGFGLVIVEGALSGLVPLRTEAAGASDQIEDGVDGFLIDADDPALLADRLAQLMADAPGREAMARRARQRMLARFSQSAMTEAVRGVYAEVLEGAA